MDAIATKAQRAMAMAMIYPEPKRGRGNKDDSRKELKAYSGRFDALRTAYDPIRT
jgi:hypothetical protein